MSKCTGLVGDSNLEAAFSSKGLLELIFILGGGQKAFFEALGRQVRPVLLPPLLRHWP